MAGTKRGPVSVLRDVVDERKVPRENIPTSHPSLGLRAHELRTGREKGEALESEDAELAPHFSSRGVGVWKGRMGCTQFCLS